jgi:ATP-binding cassette, subfamily B (MDR/TAP), member 1
MFISTYAYMCIWVYTGEVNAKRVRERYLQAVLRQDIAFFDNVGAGEVATRIQTDTRELGLSSWLSATNFRSTLQIWCSKEFRRKSLLSFISSLHLQPVSLLPMLGLGGWLLHSLRFYPVSASLEPS